MTHLFTVTGMSCVHCVKAVTGAVTSLDPAAQVKVDLDAGRVEVTSTLDRQRIAEAIAEEGYEIAA